MSLVVEYTPPVTTADTTVETRRKGGHCAGSQYLADVVQPSQRAVAVAALIKNIARKGRDEFDSIVVTGVSGLTIGAIIAHHFHKDLVVVRKDGEQAHSNYAVEGWVGSRYIILDDLIATGATVRRIMQTIREQTRNSYSGGESPVCVGFAGYSAPWQDNGHAFNRRSCDAAGVLFFC